MCSFQFKKLVALQHHVSYSIPIKFRKYSHLYPLRAVNPGRIMCSQSPAFDVQNPPTADPHGAWKQEGKRRTFSPFSLASMPSCSRIHELKTNSLRKKCHEEVVMMPCFPSLGGTCTYACHLPLWPSHWDITAFFFFKLWKFPILAAQFTRSCLWSTSFHPLF